MSDKKRAESAQSLATSDELIDYELQDDSGTGAGSKQKQQQQQQQPDEDGENVSVMVRCRPLQVSGANSTSSSSNLVVQVDESRASVQVADREFCFDQVFGMQCDNEQVYMRSARRLVDCTFRGYNCTIFLYGQTGTGKTYTHSSLTLGAFEHLFGLIQDSSKTMRFLIRASYYELYNEEIHDLLDSKSGNNGKSQRSLELRESKERGVYVKDLTCFLVNNLSELKKLKQLGDRRRTTAATRMNEHSSRSHSIFSITIETISQTPASEQQAPTSATTRKSSSSSASSSSTISSSGSKGRRGGTSAGSDGIIRVGHLNLIDLAGSERQSKSGSSGSRLKEASRINLSLTCLSLVIRALTDKTNNSSSGPNHIPYRNSKLTRLLSSSLGGNSKTILIACISPAKSNLDETLNTLRFASRTKQIKNRAVINEDPKDALLRKYRQQLNELRLKLSEQQQRLGGETGKLSQVDENQQLEEAGQLSNEGDNNETATKLKRQLELLKAKIMHGGENLLDKLELHERLLEASKSELDERRRAEMKLRERLKSKKETIEQVVQSKGSLEEQLEYLDEKLGRAMNLYKSSKLELRDLANEHELLKEQLLQTIKSTSKEIKYVDCIIEDFIPSEHLDLINAYAQYDETSDEWQVKYIALSGNNIAQTKRLIASANSMTLAARTMDDDEDDDYDDELKSGGGSRKNSMEDNKRPDPFIRFAS